MSVLVVDAWGTEGPAGSAVEALVRRGRGVVHLDLVRAGFEPFLSTAERRAYHGDEPIVTEEVRRSAEAVGAAEGVLFVYPTVGRYLPPLMKGWLDRVLVPGVGFGFDDAGRVVPGLTHVRRLGAVTDLRGRPRADGVAGRRTLLRTLRLLTSRTCRLTWGSDPTEVERALRRW